MKEKLALSERYFEAVSRVHASDALLRKVVTMNNKAKTSKKPVILRRALIAAAVAAALLVLSNVAVFAATGETWVEKLFWFDEKPAQPMENVQNFFNENAALGEASGGSAANQYYGGTYLDRETGKQVILLTDLSKSGAFTDVSENVRFEKCDYTFAELSDEIKSINEKLDSLRAQNEGYADDVVAWGLHDMENRLFVDVYQMNDEKVQWFIENVSDAPYLVFNSTDSFPQDELD